MCVFSVSCSADLLHPHSFPTRRSSDLRGDPRRHQASAYVLVITVAALSCCFARVTELRTPHGTSRTPRGVDRPRDRKSTRLNSSHRCISYAVFCLKKKNQQTHTNNSID